MRQMPSYAGSVPSRGFPGFTRALRRALPVLRAALLIERDRLTLWLPVCVGIGDAAYFTRHAEPRSWPAIGVALAGLAMLGLARRHEILRVAGTAIVACALGFLAASFATQRAPPLVELPHTASLVSGRIGAIDLFADGSRRVTFDRPAIGDEPPIARHLRVRLRADDEQTIAIGDSITLRAMLRAPASPSMPGGRDLQREAFFGGLAGSGYALGVAKIGQHAAAGRNLANRWQSLRETIAARIMAVLPGARGAIAATLLTGISSAIPQADRNAFAVSGLAHLLAVAGLHLGIVMGLVMGGLRMALALWEYAALRLPTRQISAVVALGAGALYMALTGMHLPTLRSLAMAALAVLALLLGRRALSMRGLCVAALVILLAAPDSLLEVSFQMSFAAVLALIAGYEVLRPMMTRLYGDGGWHRRLGLHAAGLFLTSLLAGAASLPYAAYHFGHIQFYFVLANLVAVPMTALWVMPEGLLSLVLMPFGMERLALLPMGWGIGVILWLAREVARLPAASIAVRAMPLWSLALISPGLIWLCLRRGRWRLLGLLPLAAGLLTPWLCQPPDLMVSSDARLIALRVDQPGGARLMLEEGSGASPLTLSDWSRSQAVETPPSYMPEAGNDGPVSCDAAVCRILLRGQTVLLMREPARRSGLATGPGVRPEACDQAALLVSPIPAGRVCLGRRRIDRFTVWREGAQAVWIGRGGVDVISDLAVRGLRPWIPIPGKRRVPALPMALTE